MPKSRFNSHVSVQITDVCERSFGFNTFSSARAFVKELLADSYEIVSVTLKVKFSQGEGEQPNIRVVGDDIFYVDFMYNAYEKHDKALLLKLLNRYSENIIHYPIMGQPSAAE